MAINGLGAADKGNFAVVLLDTTSTFAVIEKKFKESFGAAKYPAVCSELWEAFSRFMTSSEGVGLVTVLFLVDIMRKADSRSAKVLFFDILAELDRVLRKDIFQTEQTKYMSKSSKDTKEKKKSSEYIQAESYRIHSVAKVFALSLLSNNVKPEQRALLYVSKKQETLDGELEILENTGKRTNEVVKVLSEFWAGEAQNQHCSIVLSNAAVFDSQSTARAAVTVPLAQTKIPSLPISTGELKYLLGAPHCGLLFDKALSPRSAKAQQLIKRARSAPLSEEDQAALLEVLDEAMLKEAGFMKSAAVAIAKQTPELCAAILLKLPRDTAATYMESLIYSDVKPVHVDSLVLHAASALKESTVKAYIADRIKSFKDKIPVPQKDQESLKSFSITVHHLVTKASETNKEAALTDAQKAEVGKLLESCGVPEVVSRWAEMK